MTAGGTIVISGIGTVGPWGAGEDSLLLMLAAGAPVHDEIDRSEGFHVEGAPVRVGRVDPACVRPWLAPRAARRMSPPSRFAVAAAKQAAERAGWVAGERPDPGTAVVVGTAFGPSSFTQRLLDQILGDGPHAASPALFTECVANAPAARISLACMASGPNLTIVEREASGVLAVARAVALVRSGRATRAFAGVVDEMTPLLHAILGRFGALACPDRSGREVARPFDRHRSGFLASEGATVVTVERESDAVSRGIVPVVRVAGSGSGFDPGASRVGWGTEPAGLAGRLAVCLDGAGVDRRHVDLVVSGASGSVAGDRAEAAVLRAAWTGRDRPPVTAPKSLTGEYGGGFLAAALLAGRHPAATAGFREADPELGLRPIRETSGLAPANVLVQAVASGGPAAWLLLDAFAGPT